MRVTFILFSLFILYETTVQLPQNVVQTKEALTAAADNEEETVQEAACLTVRNISGICVERERCDYGPSAIDFTLYSPSWYKRPCESNDVCCPPKFLVEKKILAPPIDSFEFDDDD